MLNTHKINAIVKKLQNISKFYNREDSHQFKSNILETRDSRYKLKRQINDQ